MTEEKTPRKPKVETKPKTVAMERELQPGETGPTTADVHPDEVANWKKQGWQEAK